MAHLNLKPWKCKFCDYTASAKKNALQHAKKCALEKTCNKCDQNVHNMRQHLWTCEA